MAYDLARQTGAGEAAETRGLEVLTIAVLSILLTAPVGAAAIMLCGPILLSSDNGETQGGEVKPITRDNDEPETGEPDPLLEVNNLQAKDCSGSSRTEVLETVQCSIKID